MIETTLFSLLHILVFVYWLGGDLGAFYGSTILADPNRPAQQRLGAAVIIKNVDMAPRMALIFTLPTGLALAQSRGWLDVGWSVVVAFFLAAIVWAALAWRVHLRHDERAKRLDLFVRWFVVFGLLAGAGWASVSGVTPGFLALKFALLGGAVLLGLLIRRLIKPFEAALPALLAGDPDGAANDAIQASMKNTRRAVLALWALLVAAATAGIAA